MNTRQDGTPRRHTPPRVVRVPDDLWNAAKSTAEQNGTTVSDVIRNALSAYVKAGAAVLVAVLAILTLGACGAAEPATSPVAERTAVVGSPVAETPSVAVETPTEAAPRAALAGHSVLVNGNSLKIRALASGDYAFEVYTHEPTTFDGEFVALDSTGAEHVGTSAVEAQYGKPLSASGFGGDSITFDTADIVSITYTDDDATITWTVG